MSLNLYNPQPENVNYLRKLLADGQITPEQLSGMQTNGSFEDVPQAPPQSTNMLKQLLQPQAGNNEWQNVPRGTGVVQTTNQDGSQNAPINFGSPMNIPQQGERDFSQAQIDIPGVGRGYYGKDGQMYGPDGKRYYQPQERQRMAESSMAEQDRKMKIDKFNADQANINARTELTKNQNNELLLKPTADEMALKKAALVKLGPGEKMGVDGAVELVPGTSAYLKQAGNHAKDWGAYQAVETKTDNAIKKIDEILAPKKDGDGKEKSEGFQSQFGGYNAYLTKLLPGETQDVGAKIESLKANMKTAGLELVRAGGSIGQMTEREWPIVQDQLDKIDPRMGEQAAAAAFENIRANFERIKKNARETYDNEWANTQFGKKPARRESDLVPTDSTSKEQRYQEWKRKQGL